VIDRESERAVSRWVRLGDEIAGRRTRDKAAACEICGTTELVLDRDEHAVCAHCYLERGSATAT